MHTLLYRMDDFFFSISFSFVGVLLDLFGCALAFSISLIRVRGSVRISANDTPGTAAVLTNFSIDSAHRSRLRYLAH